MVWDVGVIKAVADAVAHSLGYIPAPSNHDNHIKPHSPPVPDEIGTCRMIRHAEPLSFRPGPPASPPCTPQRKPPQQLRTPDPTPPSSRRQTYRGVHQGVPPSLSLPRNKRNLPSPNTLPLYPHQKQTRGWMEKQEVSGYRGGILADMGLGKTLSVILRIWEALLCPDFGMGPTLIVCPAGVLSHWKEEIEKFAPFLRVFKFHGSDRMRGTMDLHSYDIILTSYDTLRLEYQSTQLFPPSPSPLFDDDKPFLRIVLDEAQCIRNTDGQKGNACFALQATHRWVLSGTLLNNRIDDLFPCFHFLGIKPYCDKQAFETDIASLIGNAEDGIPRSALDKLRFFLQEFTSAKRKEDVPELRLPPRVIHECRLDFSPEERQLYDAVEKRVKITHTQNDLIKEGSVDSRPMHSFVLLLRKRQLCISADVALRGPPLRARTSKPPSPTISDENDDQVIKEEEEEDLIQTDKKQCVICLTLLGPTSDSNSSCCNACFDSIPRLSSYFAAKGYFHDPENMKPSTKIRVMRYIIDEIERRSNGKDKVIIFSMFTSFLDVIQHFLKDRRFVRYDGSMSLSERDRSLARLKSDRDCKIGLFSFMAGSVGLNLACANHVILMDPWWNPMVEEQALNRVHHIGQTKIVHVYKLTIRGTVEDRILELQERKRELAKEVFGGISIPAKHDLESEQMMELLGFRDSANPRVEPVSHHECKNPRRACSGECYIDFDATE